MLFFEIGTPIALPATTSHVFAVTPTAFRSSRRKVMNQKINHSSIEASWNEAMMHSASVAEKASRQEHPDLYYVNYIKSFPVLSHEDEMHLGKEMDEAREQMMLAAFGTQAGISMILRQVSAFCRGELKLKDIIGHRQMESDEREESCENILKGFEELQALLANENRFQHETQIKIVDIMQRFDLGMDFVLMIVRKLQKESTPLMQARQAWFELTGILGCTQAELLKNLKRYEQHKKCKYIVTDEQYNRYMAIYQNWQTQRDVVCERFGEDPDNFEKLMSTIRAADARYERARTIMIDSNLRLVYTIVRRYTHHSIQMLDLMQEGNIGLMRAVEKYDYKLGHKFSTYATWWIKQSVARAYADQSRTVRIPIHLVDIINRINKVAHQIEYKQGRHASSEEIAKELGLPTEYVSQMQQIARTTIYLDTPVGEEEDSTVGDFIEDAHSPNQIEILSETDRANELDKVLSTLSEREEHIIRLRYGIGHTRTYTLEEVGRKFNLTRERIRQIEVRAIQKLRIPSENSDLLHFI